MLKNYKEGINKYLKNLKLELHPDKSRIKPLRNGISFLGYKIFYNYKLLRKSNLRKFEENFNEKSRLYEKGLLKYDEFRSSLQGWFGYAAWADTHSLRNNIIKRIPQSVI